MGFFDRKRREARDDAEAGTLSPGAADTLDAIGAHVDLVVAVNTHITTHFGEPFGVLRDSNRTEAIDMYVMPPTETANRSTVITSGMSRRPMQGAPEHAERAELLLSLPPDWPLEMSALDNERHWWPFRLLQNLSHLPHAQDTWLGVGHTIPHGNPPQPYADNTSLCAALLLRPFFPPPGFSTLQSGEHTVNFYGLFLLHPAELQYKLDHTTEEFFDLLAQGGVTETVDITRPSAV
jgi:hypothetical protein